MSPRDTLADAAYFTQLITKEEGYLAEDRADVRTFIEERGSRASGISSNIVKTQIICASMAYSRGDTIEDVRDRIQNAITDLRYLHELYERYADRLRHGHNAYWNHIRRLTYAILYAVDPEPLQAVIHDVEFFRKIDPILVAMLAYLKDEPVDREHDAPELDFPDQFADLWHAISLRGEAAIPPLRRYLETWYDRNLPLGGDGAPGIGAHVKMIRYQGYWCWEAAAVVVMMDIDDSTFRDHPHYPKDLVDWAKMQKANR